MTDSTMNAAQPSDSRAYFEQRIFIVSPLGTWPTVLALYALGAGLYVAAALASGVAFLPVENFLLDPRTRIAAVLLLILCISVGMQRMTRMAEKGDFEAFARVLKGGAEQAALLTSLAPRGVRLVPATVTGLIAGIALSFAFFAQNPGTALMTHPALFAWFAGATVLLIMAFTRGVALSRASASIARTVVRDQLIVDLLRTDALYVWGRAAARVAIIWFSVSAAACLLFMSGEITVFTVLILVACAAMGIWVFVAMMSQIHRKIRAVKAGELDKVRHEIARLRQSVHDDAGAGARLQGLLAYEARIAAAPEWPFDQTTLVRVGASTLILAVPWFGQAIAQYFVDHIAAIAG